MMGERNMVVLNAITARAGRSRPTWEGARATARNGLRCCSLRWAPSNRARRTSSRRMGLDAALLARRTLSSRPLANVAALLAMVVVGWHLAWLFGATSVLMLVHRVGQRTRVWLPVTMAWVGSGSLFAWGLWHLINVLGDTALIRERASSMALLNLVSLVRLTAGLVIGLVTLFVLAERRAAGVRESRLPASPTAAP